MTEGRTPGAEPTKSAISRLIPLFVAILLVGLPISVLFDLRDISENALLRQVRDLDQVITGIRGFYASGIVGHVLAGHGQTSVTAKYETTDGAIPIPATFSLELGRVVSAQQRNIAYRFVSPWPFRGRAPHALDAFETESLAALQRDPQQTLSKIEWTGFTDRVRLIAPVMMTASCVACHNSDPDSPRRDWRVGDVRGIQEISVTAPLATNVWSFKFLLGYVLFAGALGIGFIVWQRRQALTIARINEQLGRANAFLSSISATISRYLAPQVYEAIFSGRSDGSVRTERKKLTIFFSDIKDFTPTTERLQPEELTALLNEYFTEMSAIALRYGGTIDKFIGDAMVIFFGDPTTLGIAEDARACVRMAAAMIERMDELAHLWRERGIETPFRIRVGINTGYCNVGNFGSNDRLDYTIIGGEVNLAARLQGIAEPGTIVMSYETYALVRDIADAREMAPLHVKGISREVVPYTLGAIRGGDDATSVPPVEAHVTGFDLHLEPGALSPTDAERARAALRAALDRLA